MRASGMKRCLKGVIVWILAVTLSLIPSATAGAISESMLDFFAANGIYYYDPDGTQCDNYGVGGIGGSGSGGAISGGDALRQAVLQYGQFAMDLQRKYGSPWEVIFAQMVKESSVGQCTNCVASAVAAMGYYNWLGITGSGGSLGTGNPYYSPSGREWATYATVEKMMESWAGSYVLRNGRYDAAFAHLDPNNYDLDGFISTMVPIYAPPSENDSSAYISQVIGLVKTVQQIAAEQGWPTSAELARQENIQIGGETPIGSSVSSSGSSTYADACASGLQYGNIVSYILAYAWPEFHEAPYTQMKPDYEKAIKRRQSEGKYVGGAGGIDCGAFVTAVMQDSGFAPDYGGGGDTSVQEQWVKDNGWETVSDISQLVPGDVAFGNSHTFIYVGQQPGFGSTVASASAPGRTGAYARAPMAGDEKLEGVRWYHKP